MFLVLTTPTVAGGCAALARPAGHAVPHCRPIVHPGGGTVTVERDASSPTKYSITYSDPPEAYDHVMERRLKKWPGRTASTNGLTSNFRDLLPEDSLFVGVPVAVSKRVVDEPPSHAADAREIVVSNSCGKATIEVSVERAVCGGVRDGRNVILHPSLGEFCDDPVRLRMRILFWVRPSAEGLQIEDGFQVFEAASGPAISKDDSERLLLEHLAKEVGFGKYDRPSLGSAEDFPEADLHELVESGDFAVEDGKVWETKGVLLQDIQDAVRAAR